MADRPPIPSELRRIILTEARHHCAVCGYPSVDVHHIMPWAESQEHKAENLIALCQNCHRRADRREIDAASLRSYKATLPSRHPYDVRVSGACGSVESAEARWVVHRIMEQAASPRPFKVNLEFPQFLPDTGEFAVLNGIERASALQQLHEMRRLALHGPPEDDAPWSTMETVSMQTFEVTLLTSELVSFRYEAYRFNPGAAHGNTSTESRTFRLNPLVRIGLEEVFLDGQKVAAVLSKECVSTLEGESGMAEPDDWIREGAGPDLTNFRQFNLTPWGLVLTFDPYVVSSYAEGIRRVFVRKEQLLPLVRPETRVSAAWDGSAG